MPLVETSPAEALRLKIGSREHVTFASWNGKPKGLDSDELLRFYPDNRIRIEKRGIDVIEYGGTYAIGANGRITVEAKGYENGWPAMVVSREEGDLLLRREDGHTSWLPPEVLESDGLVSAETENYWPFREAGDSGE